MDGFPAFRNRNATSERQVWIEFPGKCIFTSKQNGEFMAIRKTRKTNGRRGRHITISFSDKKNLRAKPSISSAKARQFLTKVQALDERNGTAPTQACTSDGCGGVVKGVKSIATDVFGVDLTCSYGCRWFYSIGGGWQKECYFRCHDSSRQITVEGTGS
jgi:hypothetical protein